MHPKQGNNIQSSEQPTPKNYHWQLASAPQYTMKQLY